MIASQTGPAPGHWVETLPDRVAADSIVNRLAHHARTTTSATSTCADSTTTNTANQPTTRNNKRVTVPAHG